VCGIAGIYHLDAARPADPRMLQVMCDAMRHRGPDGAGFHLDGGLGLGHRRLAVTDPSPAGRQPMIAADERHVIAWNGAVYNHPELRADLVRAGHRPRSGTDTEVVVELFARSGPACLERLNGMFAIAVWDRGERRLFLARDRLGIKPLYYAWVGETLLFASEIKALLRTGLVAPVASPEGLADYTTFQLCLGERTLFRGVLKLAPGSWLTVGPAGAAAPRRYWALDFTVVEGVGAPEVADELEALLRDTTRLQLRADVPVGCQLSGGIDSSTVTCLAAALTPGGLDVFSGGFRDAPGFDETAYARLVARQAGCRHHEVFPGETDFVRIMPRLAYHLDEPAAGPGAFAQFCVAEAARHHVTVLLGGQGGDELFGGYVRYLVAYLEECLRGGIEGTHDGGKYVVTLESVVPHLAQLSGYEPLLRHFWRDGLLDPVARRYLRLIDRSHELRDVLAPEVFAPAGGYQPGEAFEAVFREGGTGSLINRMTRFDLVTLLPALLHVEDRTSMALSLESRVPLLDHRIVELTARIPPALKFQDGRTKHMLRLVAARFVPPAVVARRDKMGFPVPLRQWLAGGPVREFAADLLLGPRARERGLYRAGRVEPLLDGAAPHGRGVWGLLSLELWMRTFLDADGAGAPER
jgi:asparagine synthase (glutamine-hydrolysing)